MMSKSGLSENTPHGAHWLCGQARPLSMAEKEELRSRIIATLSSLSN